MIRQALATEATVGAAVSARRRRPDWLAAEAAFLQRLADMGAILLQAGYCGGHTPHHVRCPSGHDCYPRPNDLRRGRGICRTCAGVDPVLAEAQFRERLATIGATPLFETWAGMNRPHHVRCAVGHDSWTIPSNLRRGDGICRICAGNDTAVAEAMFRSALAGIGATPLFKTWRGARRPHHVRCAEGHDCYPWPTNLLAGRGICRVCGSKSWDAFYVVTSNQEVKLGITSGDARYRLAQHARAGYVTVIRLATGLPGTVALDAESVTLAALADAGEQPLHGREYFDISCLALVLDVADAFLPSGGSK